MNGYSSLATLLATVVGKSSSAIRPSIMRGSTRFMVSFDGNSDEAPCSQKSYRLIGQTTPKNKSGVSVTFPMTGKSLATDLPKSQGGQDKDAQPVEHLLAAWAGCTQATALFVGRQMTERLILDRLEFDNIMAYRDQRGALHLPIQEMPLVPSRIHTIRGTILVFAAREQKISVEKLKLLQEQTEVRCPVANMMAASGCQIDVRWIDGLSKSSNDNNNNNELE